MDFNFVQTYNKLKKMDFIFCKLNKLKKHGFNFLQGLKSSKNMNVPESLRKVLV